QKKLIMLPSETMIWQPEFTDKILSRKPGAVQSGSVRVYLTALNQSEHVVIPIDKLRTQQTLLRIPPPELRLHQASSLIHLLRRPGIRFSFRMLLSHIEIAMITTRHHNKFRIAIH
ncbi:hypothetical protein, partial [Escherichia coli]